jgi:hypothetical protein
MPDTSDPPWARATGAVETSTKRSPADNARMASNKVLHFKLDSARSVVEKYDKSFEVQDVHLIGDIESFPLVEPCINLHQSVDRLASVLILGKLSSKRILWANEPNVKSWFGGAFLEVKQVMSVLRSSSAGLFVPGTA